MLAAGEGDRRGMVLRVGILAQNSKIQKNFGLWPNDKGPYLLAAALRPRVILSSACLIQREEGGCM
jgi:hypothetical protein